MQVTTKYDVGQLVYTKINGRPTVAFIEGIDFTQGQISYYFPGQIREVEYRLESEVFDNVDDFLTSFKEELLQLRKEAEQTAKKNFRS